MHRELTIDLIGTLLKCGYTHFLSRTQPLSDNSAAVGVTLTPVKDPSILNNIPRNCNTVYQISESAIALGMANAIILVDITKIDLVEKCYVLTNHDHSI